MTATYLAPAPKLRLFDNNGNPAVGGMITTYKAGTVTPITTYTDSTGLVQNINPIVLNFRGECDLWLLPNVAYKLQFNDASGNLIWTIDNIVNSQLITLYGGVDTGTTNAYVLNFTASFTSYTDGSIIYWIPANTNTGASTINVNGLGVINITNADGSALVASEIIANQPATILIKGGAAILISPTTTVYGTFTPTWGGFSVNPVITSIPYRKNGTLVTLLLTGSGTSNSINFTISGVPTIIRPTTFLGVVPCFGMKDSGTNLASGAATVDGTGLITLYKDGTQVANWTNSGSKGFSGQSLIVYSI